jgi:hypothetical protein
MRIDSRDSRASQVTVASQADTPSASGRMPSRSSLRSDHFADLSPANNRRSTTSNPSNPSTQRRAPLPSTASGSPRSSAIEMQSMSRTPGEGVRPQAGDSPSQPKTNAYASASAYGSALLQGGAATLTGASLPPSLSGPTKQALVAAGGGSWGGAGVIAGANPDNTRADFASAALETAAGIAQVVSAYRPGQGEAAYTSSAFWGASAMNKMGGAARGIINREGHQTVNAAKLTSGALGLGAATLSAVGTGTGSLPANALSAGLWGGSAAVDALAHAANQRYNARGRPGDIEANYPSDPGSAA